VRKKKSSGYSLDYATGVFDHIASFPAKPHVIRIVTILDLIVAIRQENWRLKLAALRDELQTAFKHYRWTREIEFTTDEPRERMTLALRSPTLDDVWEYGAIHTLLKVAEYYPAHFRSIRQCDVCQKWMFAKRANNRFCSGKCRQHVYDNDPIRQEQHRTNMRRLYQLEKDRAEKARRRIGFTGSKRKG
jgi:hypothetical protein